MGKDAPGYPHFLPFQQCFKRPLPGARVDCLYISEFFKKKDQRQKMKVGKVESIVRMGKDAGLPAFFPLSTISQKACFSGARVDCLNISNFFEKIRQKAKDER